jgi:hypothetical protein
LTCETCNDSRPVFSITKMLKSDDVHCLKHNVIKNRDYNECKEWTEISNFKINGNDTGNAFDKSK